MVSRTRLLPPLGTLRVFEAAARHQSLVRAAEELHVTHGAVSRQIQALEDHLGERVFERRNRGIFLTDRGKWLSLRLTDLFAELTGTFQDFYAHGQPRPLIVSCEPTLCLRLMIPALADLRRETGLDVRFLAAGGPIDFRRDHVDLAIRRNDFPIEADLFCVELADEWMGPVTAPATPLSPDAPPALLHSTSRPNAWRDWQKRSGIKPVRASAISYEHFYLSIQAAEGGQGQAMASVHMVARELAEGRLVAPYGFVQDGTKYLALSSTDFALDPRKPAIIAWLIGRMRENLACLVDG